MRGLEGGEAWLLPTEGLRALPFGLGLLLEVEELYTPSEGREYFYLKCHGKVA